MKMYKEFLDLLQAYS